MSSCRFPRLRWLSLLVVVVILFAALPLLAATENQHDEEKDGYNVAIPTTRFDILVSPTAYCRNGDGTFRTFSFSYLCVKRMRLCTNTKATITPFLSLGSTQKTSPYLLVYSFQDLRSVHPSPTWNMPTLWPTQPIKMLLKWHILSWYLEADAPLNKKHEMHKWAIFWV